MRVFVTGATGMVGTAVIRELHAAGHEVLGLARSEAAAAKLTAAGVAVHRGSLTDLAGLRDGATRADAVIHTAFVHDFTDFEASVATDRAAVEALCEALVGSDKPLLITSGTPGDGSDEDTVPPLDSPVAGRFVTEELALSYVERGVRVAIVRLPRSVHGEPDTNGFVPIMIEAARRSGFSAYIDDGTKNFCAVHLLDAARLYLRVLEAAPAGVRAHAVGDGAIPGRELAETIGRRLDLPTKSLPAAEAADHLGFVGLIISTDQSTSAEATRARFDWEPIHPGLLADLEQDHYFA
ncbi:SDR family oxidoreductase [Saccharopolyspora flava]|uniref:Nucleoside-diphosphate-sugar epimerase n=1 Tax=Saccharopolyspora flava TaxID=95161 RepID=A0A1I6RMV2_9PSEU|nr:SDR family oxidoreductase [Saccharopolyspora flava]SFS65976.1 Nucleoside-diphosphate-sugar epimerase [Saccharopolyspora flava]